MAMFRAFREPESLRLSDKFYPTEILRRIDAVVRNGPVRLGNEAAPLVLAQRLNMYAGLFGQFSDSEAVRSFCPLNLVYTPYPATESSPICGR